MPRRGTRVQAANESHLAPSCELVKFGCGASVPTRCGERTVCRGAPDAGGVIAWPAPARTAAASAPGTLQTPPYQPVIYPYARAHRGCERHAGGGNRRLAYICCTRLRPPGRPRLTAVPLAGHAPPAPACERKEDRRARSLLKCRSHRHRTGIRQSSARCTGLNAALFHGRGTSPGIRPTRTNTQQRKSDQCRFGRRRPGSPHQTPRTACSPVNPRYSGSPGDSCGI